VCVCDDNDCFDYHSWRNNVVIAFGTLSSLVCVCVCVCVEFYASERERKCVCMYMCVVCQRYVEYYASEREIEIERKKRDYAFE